MAYRMLDISYYQNTLNGQVAKNQGIDTIICRAAYATSKDKRIDSFVPQIKNNGINLGVYGFLTAHYKSQNGGNFETARQKMRGQVNFWISIAKDKGVNSWFAVDEELEGGQQMALNKSQNTQLLKEACDIIKAAGFNACVYTGANWGMNYIDEDSLKYPLWVAYYYKYGTQLSFEGLDGSLPGGTYGNYLKRLQNKGLLLGWQFTSEGYGSTYGVGSTNLDKNWLYFRPQGGSQMDFVEVKNLVLKVLAEATSGCEYFSSTDVNAPLGKLTKGETYTILKKGGTEVIGEMTGTWYIIDLDGQQVYVLQLPDRCVVEEVYEGGGVGVPQETINQIKRIEEKVDNLTESVNLILEQIKEFDSKVTSIGEILVK